MTVEDIMTAYDFVGGNRERLAALLAWIQRLAEPASGQGGER